MSERKDPLNKRLEEIIDGIYQGPKHPDCSAPRITLDGTKTCVESKDRLLWCQKCVDRSEG